MTTALASTRPAPRRASLARAPIPVGRLSTGRPSLRLDVDQRVLDDALVALMDRHGCGPEGLADIYRGELELELKIVAEAERRWPRPVDPVVVADYLEMIWQTL